MTKVGVQGRDQSFLEVNSTASLKGLSTSGHNFGHNFAHTPGPQQSLATESWPAASWLQPEHRLGHFQALERMLADGGSLSPIFSIPFMDMKTLRVDWLHCADQGVASVFLGGLFHMILADRTYGRNIEARCARLWAEVQAFYDEHQTKDRLHNLTVTTMKTNRAVWSSVGVELRSGVWFLLEDCW